MSNENNSNRNIEPSSSYDGALKVSERLIIDFLTQNPGSTKQRVVDVLDGRYSRVIVFDAIKELERCNIIIIRKHKPNSQVHSLHLSESNPILKEVNRLSRFESAIMDLFDKIKDLDIKASYYIEEYLLRAKRSIVEKKKFDSLKFLESNPGAGQLKMYEDMYLELFQVFWKVVQSYTIQVSFIWPFQIENKHIVNRLIHTVVEKLADIQMKVAQVVYDTNSPAMKKGGIHLINIGTILNKANISSQITKKEVKNFQHSGLSKEIKDLSSSLNDIIRNMYLNSNSLPNPWINTEEELTQESMFKSYEEGRHVEGQQSTPDSPNETLPKKGKKKPT